MRPEYTRTTQALAARMANRALDRGTVPDPGHIADASGLSLSEVRSIIAAETTARAKPPPPAPHPPPDPAAGGGPLPHDMRTAFVGGMSYAVDTIRTELLRQVDNAGHPDCIACRTRLLVAAESAVWLDRELTAWAHEPPM